MVRKATSRLRPCQSQLFDGGGLRYPVFARLGSRDVRLEGAAFRCKADMAGSRSAQVDRQGWRGFVAAGLVLRNIKINSSLRLLHKGWVRISP